MPLNTFINRQVVGIITTAIAISERSQVDDLYPNKLNTFVLELGRSDNEVIKKYLVGVNFCIKVDIKIWLLCIFRNKNGFEVRAWCFLNLSAAQSSSYQEIISKLITLNFMSKSICERVAYWKTLILNEGLRWYFWSLATLIFMPLKWMWNEHYQLYDAFARLLFKTELSPLV